MINPMESMQRLQRSNESAERGSNGLSQGQVVALTRMEARLRMVFATTSDQTRLRMKATMQEVERHACDWSAEAIDRATDWIIDNCRHFPNVWEIRDAARRAQSGTTTGDIDAGVEQVTGDEQHELCCIALLTNSRILASSNRNLAGDGHESAVTYGRMLAHAESSPLRVRMKVRDMLAKVRDYLDGGSEYRDLTEDEKRLAFTMRNYANDGGARYWHNGECRKTLSPRQAAQHLQAAWRQ